METTNDWRSTVRRFWHVVSSWVFCRQNNSIKETARARIKRRLKIIEDSYQHPVGA